MLWFDKLSKGNGFLIYDKFRKNQTKEVTKIKNDLLPLISIITDRIC